MGLKLLSFGNEPDVQESMEITFVPAAAADSTDPEDQPEMPEIDLMEDQGKEIAAVMDILEDFQEKARAEGVSRTDVVALESYVEGLRKQLNNYVGYTPCRSIEGLAPALEAAEEAKTAVLQRFLQWVKELYAKIIAWFKKVFGPKGTNVEKEAVVEQKAQEVEKEKRSQDFFKSVRQDKESAQAEIIAAVDQDNADFAYGIQSTMDQVEKVMEAFYALAARTPLTQAICTGEFKTGGSEDYRVASEAVAQLKTASQTLDKALKCRNVEQFQQQLEEVRKVSQEIGEFLQGATVFDPSTVKATIAVSSMGYTEICTNLQSAVKNRSSKNLDFALKDYAQSLESIAQLADETNFSVISEMVPSGYDQETRKSAITEIRQLAELTAVLARKFLYIWKTRAEVTSVLVNLLEASTTVSDVARSSLNASMGPLSPENRQKLADYFAKYGIVLAVQDDSKGPGGPTP